MVSCINKILLDENIHINERNMLISIATRDKGPNGFHFNAWSVSSRFMINLAICLMHGLEAQILKTFAYKRII